MSARRSWALPLVPLYAAGLAVKDGLRSAGVLRVKKLKWPVVSVGSLSAGGAGKTPVVIALAELLQARGWEVDVLSRGYGRKESGVARVDAESTDAAIRFGDEPVLIASHARVPVWVGAGRFAAGTAAEAASPTKQRGVHLLDDGFQHRQLARSVDVVLVTEDDLHDALLPAGNRREPLAALRGADVIVLREDERERVQPLLQGRLREGALVWSVRRQLILTVPVDQLSSGARPFAFCAIARPDGFWWMLQQAGLDVAGKLSFPDHHPYSVADVDHLVMAAKASNATGFVTTAKDRVKLSSATIDRLRSIGPLDVLNLEASFLNQEEVVRDLEARLS
ncbi:MAG: tetraacyldisaccharide 4'-kinase [Acidobacteriota bacterium]|nr:tetraacyldisaccharide 4'-kinase [Acidobacteriota bacterium]